MSQESVKMPGVFGGLMRYDDEFDSRFNFSPAAVMVFIGLIVAFVFALKIFLPAGV